VSLTPGARLGAYEVVARIGAGGMGEVYRARDTKLGRDVALKILPDAFATDPDRLSRFQREAQVLASLNHPYIGAIYGFEDSDGTRALVLELVDGPTLADRIAQGPIPLGEALQIAKQIAEALEAAHEQGIIHRDLKPSNIKLRSDGTVKVLDFGLAKALEPASGSADVSHSPTITSPAMTQAGVILGTAAYMSPEQAKGKVVDKRADIWAFGAVLYEMLTGKRAFEAEGMSDTIAAVLRAEPGWTALSAIVPEPTTRLLRRCLEKDPKRRLRDIGDAVIDIQEAIAAASSPENHSQARDAWVAWLRRALAIAGPTAVVCVLAGFAVGRARRGDLTTPASGAGSVSRTVIELPAAAPLAVGTLLPLIGVESPALAVSPDGRHLIYVGQADAGTHLYYRDMNSFAEPRPLPGTEGAVHAVFSPDGTEIAFLTFDRLKKTSINSGSPTTLSRARTPLRASWVGSVIYFSEDQGRTLSRVPATGGEPTEVTRLEAGGVFDQVLPGGRAALVSSRSVGSISRDYGVVQLLMFDDLRSKPVLMSAYDARYLPSGHLQFARAGALLAVPFDLERLEVTGDETVVLRDVGMESIFGNVHAVFSDNGTLVYVSGGDLARGKLAWVDRKGRGGLLPVPERVYGLFDVGPDDRRIAAGVADVNDYIWIWDDALQAGQVLASGASAPRWDSTGERIAFLSGGAFRNEHLMLQEVRGGSAQVLLSPGATPTAWGNGSISLDDQFGLRVAIIRAKPGGQPNWMKLSARAWGSGLSPDGRYLSYATDDSGRFEVWVREMNGALHGQVSTEGGIESVWCGRCDELFYRSGNRILASRIVRDPTVAFGPPRVAFVADEFVDTPGHSFDVSSDGQRLYYVRRTMLPERSRIRVIQNWFEELKRLVPTK
jgi:serine/threonine-protein kinase